MISDKWLKFLFSLYSLFPIPFCAELLTPRVERQGTSFLPVRVRAHICESERKKMEPIRKENAIHFLLILSDSRESAFLFCSTKAVF